MNNLKELYQLLKSDSIDIDAIELAESLWLSKYISKTKQPLPSDNDNGSNTDIKKKDELKPPPIDHTPPPPTNSKVKQLKKKKREDIPLHPISDKDNKNSLPFRTPLVRKLYKDNDLIFAFREFRQKIVSLKKSKLDEEKIADYIAKTDIFRPFYKKSYEKRFRVLFMVDSSESMKIWESLIDDFIKSVKSYHIFKEVVVCYISTDSKEPQFFKKKALTSLLNDRWYKHIDSNTIAFIFSDMMSKSWSSGVLLEQMSLWQNHFPFALVQMLPQRLWNGTKLIDASMGKMSSHKKFALNSQIVSRAEEILAREEEELPELVKIPLLNFNPSSIEAYGKIMRSLPNNRIEGALFEIEDFRGEYQLAKESSELNAEQRLRGFYKYASREAKELLELLAVVPLSLPIIKLVQQKLLPHSTQEHLSEVFMSSIIDKEQKVDGFYQFSKYEDEESGVREELIKKIGARQAFQTIVKLSEVIRKQGGVFDFLAFVVDPDSLKQSDEFSEIDREFARISVAVLCEMGGEYFAFADRLVECLEGVEDDIEIVIPDSKRFMLPYLDDEEFEAKIKSYNKLIKNTKYHIHYNYESSFVSPKFMSKSLSIINYDYSISENYITSKEWNIYLLDTKETPLLDEKKKFSWEEASRYCEWLSKKTNKRYKLPSYKEWFHAFSQHELKNNILMGHSEWTESEYKDVSLGKVNIWNNNFYKLSVEKNPNNYSFLGVYPTKEQVNWVYEDKEFFHIVEIEIDKNSKINEEIEPEMIRILNSLSVDTVKIPNKNYEMGRYPITIAEYMHFVRDTDSHYPEWYEKNLPEYENMNLTDNAPIIGVSWYDAVAYCEWLSEKTGKRYRLPTYSEWKYSCREGTEAQKNFYKNAYLAGEKPPINLELYTMLVSNIWEWTSWYRSEGIIICGMGGGCDSSDIIPVPNYTSPKIGFRILRELD